MIYVKKLNLKETDRTPVITMEQEEDLKKLVEKFPDKMSAIKHVNTYYGVYPIGKGGPFGDYLGSLHDVSKSTLIEIIATGKYAVNNTFEAALELLRQKAEADLKEATEQKCFSEDRRYIQGNLEGITRSQEVIKGLLSQRVVLSDYFNITQDTEKNILVLAPKDGTDIKVGNNNTVTVNLKYIGLDWSGDFDEE